jgi:deoxyguanosine kinase
VNGRYIAVEGPIGVGKSALVQALSKRFKAALYLDHPNPFLPSFYDDMEKYAFQVQLYFLLSRFQQQRDLAQGDLFASTIICDYLFQKDRLFASLTLGAAEFALYEKVYSLLKGTIATPDVVIYLQADVDTLLDRLSAKEEGLALLMPRSYLEDVVKAFQTFFFHFNTAPVIVCNTAQDDFSDDPKNLDLLVDKIGQVKTGIHYLNP